MDLLNLFRVNAHVQMCNDFCYVQIENNVEMKRSDPVKKNLTKPQKSEYES